MFVDETFSRRSLIANSTSALLLRPRFSSRRAQHNPLQNVAEVPNTVVITTEVGSLSLRRNKSKWQGRELEVGVAAQSNELSVTLLSPRESVLRIHLRWQLDTPANLQFLGDDWERSYGTLAWRGMEPERIMPWYFLAFDGTSTFASGVKTASSALCFWQVDPAGVSLWLDLRNGGRGVRLGARQLQVASILTASYRAITPFQAAQRFCHRLSPTPRLPPQTVYGGNNWYYAYGKSSAADIRDDSDRISSLASSNQNRPFMVIDDGWEPNPVCGPFSRGNPRFPDMPQLASAMQSVGVRPGLWIRPLFTKDEIAPGWRLHSPGAERGYAARQAFTIDPTVPEALEAIQHDIRTAVSWGYGLIKHDFSTYDLLGRWGFAMGAELTEAGWNFADPTRTNTEIIRDFYRALRDAAGTALLLGCNTVGHLSAGLFELQRIGDDTSGRDWNRTRKMGVNTLAFRAPQHGAFFAIDADCVGITKNIPWYFNRQWLDLLARSGTPLFVSLAPDALGPEQRPALKQAFAVASAPAPLAEPVDWLANNQPQKWLLAGQLATYNWYGTEGVSPEGF